MSQNASLAVSMMENIKKRNKITFCSLTNESNLVIITPPSNNAVYSNRTPLGSITSHLLSFSLPTVFRRLSARPPPSLLLPRWRVTHPEPRPRWPCWAQAPPCWPGMKAHTWRALRTRPQLLALPACRTTWVGSPWGERRCSGGRSAGLVVCGDLDTDLSGLFLPHCNDRIEKGLFRLLLAHKIKYHANNTIQLKYVWPSIDTTLLLDSADALCLPYWSDFSAPCALRALEGLIRLLHSKHFYSRSLDWRNRSKPGAITCAPFITVCDIVCSQYLTWLGCSHPCWQHRVTDCFDTCASLVSMSGQWVLRNKDSGLVRAVFHPFSELMVNQLVLLLIIWPGADCYYEKLITAVTVLVISQQWYFVCEFVWCPYFDYICVCMQPCCQIRVYWTHVYRSMKRSMYRWSSDEEKE